MKSTIIKHKCLIVIFTCLTASLLIANLTYANRVEVWKYVDTEHTIILYKQDRDLIKFHKSIAKWGINRLLPSKVGVIKDVDDTFKLVKLILGVEQNMAKIKIKLYPTKQALHKEYHAIYGEQSDARAWYIFEYRSIYINVCDVHRGLLGHEIAHAVVDDYLGERPPTEMGEILARYVDRKIRGK